MIVPVILDVRPFLCRLTGGLPGLLLQLRRVPLRGGAGLLDTAAQFLAALAWLFAGGRGGILCALSTLRQLTKNLG